MIEAKDITAYRDLRGEVYPAWKEGGEEISFVEDRFSRSKKGTIRGFHGDSTTWKLCVCVYGSLKLVVWDIKKSERYDFTLNDFDKQQVLIPPFHLNAHECLSDECILYYKWSSPYAGPENQWTVSHDDKTINASWSSNRKIISERERKAKPLYECIEYE